MEHTLLVKPGAWEARGSFRDEQDNSADMSGEYVIVHEAREWIGDCVMRVQSTPPIEFRNRYFIRPLPPSESVTTWTCDDAELGRLYGSFLVTGEKIVSVYSTGDGTYSGFEHCTLQLDGTYLADGMLMHRKTRVCSWHATLTQRA